MLFSCSCLLEFRIGSLQRAEMSSLLEEEGREHFRSLHIVSFPRSLLATIFLKLMRVAQNQTVEKSYFMNADFCFLLLVYKFTVMSCKE